MPPGCVRDYEVLIHDGSEWKTVASVEDNYQRRRIHRFDAMQASKVKVNMTATNGDKSARLYEVRFYNE